MLITPLSGGYYLSTYMFMEVKGFSKITYHKVGKAEFELRANVLFVTSNRFQCLIDGPD